jgi:hypothetical protein
MSAPRMPTQMASWLYEPSAPRMATGATSEMYTGTTHDDSPMPTPAQCPATHKLRIVTLGVSGGGRSRGRYETPADFPLQDCSPYRELHVRRESLGFVHRSRASFCRAVRMCQTRSHDSQFFRRCTMYLSAM